jgi:uroporphyrinogen III methyltransferase/synthase
LDVRGKKILFPRSSLPNPYLKGELTKQGAQVDPLTVYRNVKPQKRDLPKVPISKILFTSPSTVRNFVEDYGRIPDQWKILSKGPLTSRSLREAGYESEVLTYD